MPSLISVPLTASGPVLAFSRPILIGSRWAWATRAAPETISPTTSPTSTRESRFCPIGVPLSLGGRDDISFDELIGLLHQGLWGTELVRASRSKTSPDWYFVVSRSSSFSLFDTPLGSGRPLPRKIGQTTSKRRLRDRRLAPVGAVETWRDVDN